MPLHKLFFSLLLVLLPTQLGYHFWPEWAMVLGRRVDYLSPTIYFTDVLIFLTLVSWFIESFHKFSIFNFQFSIKQRNVQFLIFAIAFAITNIFFAANQPVAIYKWIKVLEFVSLGYYIIKTKPAFSFVIWHLSFGILFSSILAIAQFTLQHSAGGPLWWLGERTFTVDTPGIARVSMRQCINASLCGEILRPYATFSHPNVLGGYLATLLPALIFNFKFLISNQTKKIQMFQMVTIALGFVALVLTGSRAAMVVGLLAGIVTFLKIKNQRSKIKDTTQKLKIFIPILLLLVLGSWFVVGSFQSTDESIVVRNQLNAAAIKLWQQSPVVGVGLGNFLVELPNALPSRAIYFLQPVHNIYLLVLAETGIIGLTLVFLFISKGIRSLVLGIREKKKQFFIFHFSFFILLLLGFVDHYPLTLQQGQLLLTIFLSVTMSAW